MGSMNTTLRVPLTKFRRTELALLAVLTVRQKNTSYMSERGEVNATLPLSCFSEARNQ